MRAIASSEEHKVHRTMPFAPDGLKTPGDVL